MTHLTFCINHSAELLSELCVLYERYGIKFLKMIKPNNTHWNSKLMMLEWVIHLRPTLTNLYGIPSIAKCFKIGKWRLDDIE